jgi:transcriptional regulatory protein RtcR
MLPSPFLISCYCEEGAVDIGHAVVGFGRSSITVRAPDGSDTTIAVANIATRTPPVSAMPPMGQLLSKQDVRHILTINNEWDFEDVFSSLHAFARAYSFDTDREDYFVHITTGTHVVQICLFLLTESRHFPAQLLQTSPPRRRKSRSPGEFTCIDLDLSRYDSLAARFAEERREASSFLKSGIPTRNEAFNDLIAQIERVAVRSRDPILLLGPTGAGKSRLAERIYQLRRQREQMSGEFVPVNCATLRGDGAMSALFGHVTGAFTGAVRDRPGLLKQADGGVLFLDEVGELGLEEQAMLLRAIEQRRFLPVGADAEIASDFQLICGTNQDLAAESANGGFRGDLLSRINLWSWTLPGLAERREDLEPNLDYELDQYAARVGQRAAFNREARNAFLRFARSAESPWTGNFCDLSAAVTRMATLSDNGRIDREIVSEEIRRLQGDWRASSREPELDILEAALSAEDVAEIDRFDRVQLAAVIRVCRSAASLSEAGRTLFAASRRKKSNPNDSDRLRKYLARFNLSFRGLCEEAPERRH